MHPSRTLRVIRAMRIRVMLCASCMAIVSSASPAAAHDVADVALEQRLIRAALEQAGPWIVRIDTVGGALPVQSASPLGPPRQAPAFRQADGPATGVIWSADGWIVTSSFNFMRDPTVITVTLADGRRFVARMIARDRPMRLALLKIDTAELSSPPHAPFADLRVGQRVLTAGRAYGGSVPAPSVGVLSALRRFDGVAVQTDAKTSPANYGGPLFDLSARLIGVVVPLGPGGGELAGIEWYDSGIGFAVPAELVAARIERMKAGDDLERGVLGIRFAARQPLVGVPWPEAPPDAPPSDEQNGEDLEAPPIDPEGLVITAPPLGPALEAGLTLGDVVLAINETPTRTGLQLRRALARQAAGDRITLTYRRGDQRVQVELTLASPAEMAAASDGADAVDEAEPSPDPSPTDE